MDKFAKKGLIIDLVLIVTIFFVLCRGVDEVPFFPDESQWIATSGVFEAYFSGDYDSPIWDISYWTVTQPPLTRYLIGFGRFLGGYSSEQLNSPWDFLNHDSTSLKEGSMLPPGLLFWSRIPMAVLASFSIAIVAVLLHKTVGLTSALIWSYLSLSNTYFAVIIRRAMGDSPLLFFIVMVTLLSYLYLNQSAFSKKVIIPRPYLMAIFIGVLVGSPSIQTEWYCIHIWRFSSG
jgi:dolichyl-phosphate-mannose--protein O-mannosyl transferase